MLDVSDPRVVRFLQENYSTETKLRVRWFQKNIEQLLVTAGKGRVLKDITTAHVFAEQVTPGVEALRKIHKDNEVNRRRIPIRDVKDIKGTEHLKKTHSIKDVGLATVPDARLERPASDLKLDPIMRPVPDEEEAIIYKDVGFGRVEYLRSRYRRNPDDKFYFCECDSWCYGWRLGDSRLPELSRADPRRGSRYVLTRDTRSRSGPQQDPSHYNEPVAGDYNYCSRSN